jgi:Bacterial tandem repeat domain 1/Papain family cysteine protease
MMSTTLRTDVSAHLRATSAVQPLLMDRVEHQAQLADFLRIATDLGRIEMPLRGAQQPAQVSLAQWQTPIQDQAGRGTCWAFAGAAALEAAYHRLLGHPIKVSEEYIYHVGRIGRVELGGRTEYPCSLWNGQGCSNVVMMMQHDAICAQDQSRPYVTTDADQQAIARAVGASGDAGRIAPREADLFEFSDLHIPLLARVNARYRVADWAAVSPNVADVKAVLNAGHEVICDYNHRNGGHTLLVIGYDDARSVFIAKNSWGGTAYTEIPYSGDTDFLMMTGAAYIKSVVDPTFIQNEACWIGRWHTTINGLPFEVFVRRHSPLPGYAGDSLGAAWSPLGEHKVTGRISDNGMTATLRIERSVIEVPRVFPFDFEPSDGTTTLTMSLDHADPYVVIGQATGAFLGGVVMTRFEQRYAAVWEPNDGTAWRAFHGTPSADYQSLFDAQAAEGLRLTGIQGSAQATTSEIASIWRAQDGAGWSASHGQSADDYQRSFDQNTARNQRLVNVTGYAERGQARFASLWTDSAGRGWKARHGMDSAEFQAEFDRALAEGFALRQVSGYRDGIERRFVALWEHAPDEDCAARHGLTEEELQAAHQSHAAQGQNLSWLSVWPDTGRPRYAAIWTSHAPATTLQTGLTSQQYQAEFNRLGNAGLRPRCVASYEHGI